ncbi:MAG: ATP-binding protein [Candidatus Helarchaeota archaeon]|nr:ATP-binding protein [Candidatus Helarchaeota archaeon]
MASFDYMTPCSPSNFVGRKREIDLFKAQMDKVMAGEETAKGIIIHGRSGIGKTSLINKLVTVAQNSSCYVISHEIPLVGAEYVLDDLRAEIETLPKGKPFQKPTKRGKKGKKAPFVKRSYEIIDREKYLAEFFKKFTKKLDGNQKKVVKKGMKGIVVFIDNIERFLFLDLDVAFDILKGICDQITTVDKKGRPFNIPILFVISAWERYYPKIKYILTNFEEIGVPTLNMADANELLMKHETGAGLSIDEEVRERLIETSLNVPQMILYNGGYISENREGVREITKDLWNEKLEADVKTGFDRELVGISEGERKIMQAFSMETVNFADLVKISQGSGLQLKECEAELNNLISKKMISKEAAYYYITLNAFWEHLRNSLGDIAIGAQAKGIMLVAEDDAENGRLFSDFLHDEMERLRTDAVTAGLVAPIELIARGYERIFNSCFRYKYYNASFEYILLAGESYVKINEIEKASLILERATNMFKANDLGDYARDVLTKTIDTYQLLGDQTKVRELKLDLAQLSLSKAEENMATNNFPLARANYSRAQRLLDDVGETDQLINMIKTAADTFMEKQEFFYAWQFYGKLSDVYLKTGDNSTAASILKQAADKFTSIGQNKFADKLNEQLSKKIPVGGT